MYNSKKSRVNFSAVENLQDKAIKVRRVVRVLKGGRRFSFSATVVVGNKEGIVGYGLGKSLETTDAISKATFQAKKNLIKVPLINDTIPHQVEARHDGALVLLKPASPGTGVIAGGAMRAMLEMVGIKNVLAKSKGSSSANNVVIATFKAFQMLRDPYMIAEQRGISVQKVFNG